ncbi:MAG: hypothetical protein AW07_03564 [Candidatus Accumulibacter sp. SK-11]|nr:MAG: hypothetical protein AW07_03564 [Candidatus Accumulibacter sp. SK-11]
MTVRRPLPPHKPRPVAAASPARRAGLARGLLLCRPGSEALRRVLPLANRKREHRREYLRPGPPSSRSEPPVGADATFGLTAGCVRS